MPLRFASNDLAEVRVAMARSTEIHTRLWPITEELARSAPDSQVLALFIESLNETIDLHETRVIAGVYTRVPETILILLLLGALLTLGGMVGYSAGLTQRRSDLAGIVLIVILGGVITLIVDLDRPRDGFVRVSVQPLMDLQGQIGAPEMTRLD